MPVGYRRLSFTVARRETRGVLDLSRERHQRVTSSCNERWKGSDGLDQGDAI